MELTAIRLPVRAGQVLARTWLLCLLLAAGVSWQSADSIPPLDLTQISQPPSAAHWLGTDPFGRDVLADLLAGTRNLLTVSVPGAVLASALGLVLGAAAGYWNNSGLLVRRSVLWVVALGGLGALLTPPTAAPWWALGAGILLYPAARLSQVSIALPLDQLVLGASTFLSAVPRLVIVLTLTSLHEPSRPWLLLILSLTCWPTTATLTRSQIQQLRHQPYVEAGHAAGYSDQRLLLRHILPNAWPSLRAILPLNLSICMSLQTTLTFLSVGLPPDQADWGRTLANARLEPGAWWLIVSTLILLTLTIIALRQLLPSSSAHIAPG